MQRLCLLINCKLNLNMGLQGLLIFRNGGDTEYLDTGMMRKTFQHFKLLQRKKLEWNDNIGKDPDVFYLKFINKSFEEIARDKSVLRYFHLNVFWQLCAYTFSCRVWCVRGAK